MTITHVTSGETLTGPVAAGDQVVVLSGGSTSATDIAGVETVELGGSATAPVVEDGGTFEAGGTFDNSGDSGSVAVYGVENVSTTISPVATTIPCRSRTRCGRAA